MAHFIQCGAVLVQFEQVNRVLIGIVVAATEEFDGGVLLDPGLYNLLERPVIGIALAGMGAIGDQ